MFLDKKLLKRSLFIDIETVSEYPEYTALPEFKKVLWKNKADLLRKGISSPDNTAPDDASLYQSKAGIYAEFAKVVCISMGFLHFENGEVSSLRLKSLAGPVEHRILDDFSRVLINHYNDPENSRLCGHNIKEFDIPFLCRRMVVNQIQFPPVLDISGKKPWQTGHILDTMDMWRFGDYKNYTALATLAGALNIESPKDDIDGSMVSKVFWEEGNIDRIVTYCQKDVVTVAQIMMKFAGLPCFSQEDIEYINPKE